MFAVTAGFFAVIFLFGIVLRGITLDILSFILGNAYYPLLSLRYIVIILSYIAIILFIIFRTISNVTKHLDRVAQSVNTVFQKDAVYVELPKELKEIETKLNQIKYISMENERLAKEAEQRKNDLVVYLAHDLKTPLTSIIGYLTLLEEAPDMPIEQRAKYTTITLDKSYRLEQLINEFFDITRFNLQSIELEKNKINLSRMLHQMIDEFYPMFIEKELTTETSIVDNIEIYGDADKLARVFDNLLRNSVSYSYPNTTLIIKGEITEGMVNISFKNAGDEIPQQKLDMIFEKFFRVDTARQSKTGGAGLGLAIAKQIVEKHNGTIVASSNIDYTEFTISLPLKP